jgi:hypothetical protein
MIVYNKKGESLEVTLRFARPEEALQIIALITKQHGAAYYPEMYEEPHVHKLIEDKIMYVVVVETEAGIVGTIGAKPKSIFAGALLLTMLILKPAIRGFGLSKKLQQFILEALPFDTFACVYGHCMTINTISQMNHIKLGYRLTGLLLNCYQYDPTAEYLADIPLPLKETLVVACLPQVKQDAGDLYAPPAYIAYIEEVYISLGTAYTISTDNEYEAAVVQSKYSIHQDEQHRYCEVFILEAALDIGDIFDEMLIQYAALEYQTFNVFINLNDPATPHTCRLLEDRGFFFAGLQPLSDNYEYMIMHYSPSIPVLFDKIAIVSEFSKQLLCIQRFYQEALNVTKD